MIERRHFLAMLASSSALLGSPPSQAASLSDWIADIRLIYRFKAAEIPVKSYSIPSASMSPTLVPGDVVLADLRSVGDAPMRGELLVVKLVGKKDVLVIKRVIGLAGDQIQLKGGILFINGQAVPRRRIEDFVSADGEHLSQYVETLPGGFQHRIVERSDNGPLDNTDVYIVPADHWFGLGDNRDNSLDSRVLGSGGDPAPVGYIPPERTVGRIVYRLRPNADWLVSPQTIPGLPPQ